MRVTMGSFYLVSPHITSTSWFSLMSCVVGVCSKGCALISRRERMTFGVRCWWSACAALHLPHLLAARQLFALSVQNELSLSLSLALARSRECCFAKGGRLSCTRRPQNTWTSIGFGSLDNWNAGSAIIILLKSMIIISLGCINQPSDWLTYQPTTPSPYIQQALLLVCVIARVCTNTASWQLLAKAGASNLLARHAKQVEDGASCFARYPKLFQKNKFLLKMEAILELRTLPIYTNQNNASYNERWMNILINLKFLE